MKEKIQSYLVFTSGVYKLLQFLVVPVCMIALQFLLAGVDLLLLQWTLVCVLVFVEVMLDHMTFGGIAMKDGRQLEYFKGSRKGIRIIKSALWVNLIRILVQGAFIFLICLGIKYWNKGPEVFQKEEMVRYLAVFVMYYFCMIVQLTIVRFFDGLSINMGVAGVGTLFMSFVYAAVLVLPYVMLPVLLILSVVASVINVWIIKKRVEVSYSDGKS